MLRAVQVGLLKEEGLMGHGSTPVYEYAFIIKFDLLRNKSIIQEITLGYICYACPPLDRNKRVLVFTCQINLIGSFDCEDNRRIFRSGISL